MNVWDHRRLGGTDYEIRCDGKVAALVSIHREFQPPMAVRDIVATLANRAGGTIAAESAPIPAEPRPAGDVYEDSDVLDVDARAWWCTLSPRQRFAWRKVVGSQHPQRRRHSVQATAFLMHGGRVVADARRRYYQGAA